MTGQVKMFTSLVDDAGDHEQVSFGDNSKGRISGLGEISLTNDQSLSNVLFVDSCSYNLLSIAQFVTLVFHAHLIMKGSQLLTRKLMKLFSRDFAMEIFIL
jgi:hypothetical protein